MSAAKPPAASRWSAAFYALLALREAILCLLIIAGAIAGGIWAWREWSPAIAASPQFTIRADQIELNPPPPWVQCDVKAAVIQDGGLDRLPLLDPQTTIKAARALEAHPWVAKVRRVSKQPGPMLVAEVEYRRPVAMVEVVADNQRGLLPVDGAGVVLPSDDFLDSQGRLVDFAQKLPRIDSGGTAPAGIVGAAWGDRRIEGASRLAAALLEYWQQLGFYRILCEDAVTPVESSAPTYRLATRDKREVVWGAAPGDEAEGEPAPAVKIGRLSRWAQSPIDSSQLDLRTARLQR